MTGPSAANSHDERRKLRRLAQRLLKRRLRYGVRIWPANQGTLYLGRNKAKRERRAGAK